MVNADLELHQRCLVPHAAPQTVKHKLGTTGPACQSNTVHCLAAAKVHSLFDLPPTTLRHMPENCLGHPFPLDFRQMHSQMAHKGGLLSFSEPPSSQPVLLGCLTGAFVASFDTCKPPCTRAHTSARFNEWMCQLPGYFPCC